MSEKATTDIPPPPPLPMGAGPAVPGPSSSDTGEEKKEESIPVTAVAMKLLDLRLKPSGAIITSSIGEYTREKAQEVVVAKSNGALELYEITTVADKDDDDDDGEGNISLKLSRRLETHSILRGLVNVRLTGEKRDLVAVSSDSGALSIVDLLRNE